MGFEKKDPAAMTPEEMRAYIADLTSGLERTEGELEKKKGEIKKANAESAERRVENEGLSKKLSDLENRFKGVEAKEQTAEEILALSKTLNAENLKFKEILEAQINPALEKLTESQQAIVNTISDPSQKIALIKEFSVISQPAAQTTVKPPQPSADAFGKPHAGIITYENREALIEALEKKATESKTPNDRMRWITEAVIPERMREAGKEVADALYAEAMNVNAKKMQDQISAGEKQAEKGG